jgi:dimethylamine/trimethylamine dehydrogenase
MRDPRYDILFEPVRIGPVTAKNRFYQVPHCNGMGHRHPRAVAEMRGVKAEGGWAVVCTEETEIHPTSDVSPYIELRNWDDRDIPALAMIPDKIHEHGALAGIELVHNGLHVSNLYSREAPIAPTHLPVHWIDPIQARRMDKADIADLRRWHRDAIERSIRAGFDLVYVYAGHQMTVIQQFLTRRYNDRTDDYGGSLENRIRLLREMLEDAREQCDGRAAVACRLCVDEMIGTDGLERDEIEEIVGTLAEHPDLWDFQLGTWDHDSESARFKAEGYQEAHVRGLKQLTTKPVVGVGRFTSPDLMVRQVTGGILDMIGAARPSIADPFLPKKIEEGRLEDIRECIGCNICMTGDMLMTPIRCTQNPSMGEEWRRGWHPEIYRTTERPGRVLVVGTGPAGLEAAQSLGKRGLEVVVVEATRELGGRVAAEASLPGLASWRRVVDYRVGQIDRLSNVEIYRESEMDVDEALAYGFDHICVATGSTWRADGVGRWHTHPLPIDATMQLLTPDQIMAGALPTGHRVVVFDDDHYYMGGVLAEFLTTAGFVVELVTPEPLVSAWTVNTKEQGRIHRRLLEHGVVVRTQEAVTAVDAGGVEVTSGVTGTMRAVECDAVVMVTARLPRDDLSRGLGAAQDRWNDAGLRSVRAIGDAWAPGTIAAAVWWGRRYAEELDQRVPQPVPFDRDLVVPPT